MIAYTIYIEMNLKNIKMFGDFCYTLLLIKEFKLPEKNMDY